jgi:peptidoglycan/xylan/chitin deacetylase (PgdA/CDA1 family)
MYHDIVAPGLADSSGFPGRDAARYKVSPSVFADHLRAICAKGAAPVLTFDDGGASAMEAADILERFGLRGRFFVTANYVGTPGFVDAAGLRELHRRGHVVGSHSCSHPLRMGHCSLAQLRHEWTRSRAVLADALGADVLEASVPGGDFAPAVAETAAAAGFVTLFTSEPAPGSRRAFGLDLRGSFTIHSWTTAATAAGLAAGARLPAARQALTWNAKKLSKRLGGEQYLRVRRLVLRHGDEVRWGDEAAMHD